MPRDNWPLGALLHNAQGKTSARKVADRSQGRFSATTWRHLVTGIMYRDGEPTEYRPEPQTVIDAANAVGIKNVDHALRLAGFDPENLPGQAGRVGRPDLDDFTDAELLGAVEERLRRLRGGQAATKRSDKADDLDQEKRGADLYVLAARGQADSAPERREAEWATRGQESQDPGSDEPL